MIFDTLLAEADRPFVSVLLGTRQVGKSYLMRNLALAFAAKGKTTAWFDLEEPATLREFTKDEETLLGILRSAGELLFIDEFQYLKGATRVLKALVDGPKAPKVYVSGSSSIEIHRHLDESLAGRHRIHIIHPLAWHGEYGWVEGADFDDYLAFGGLPGNLHEADEAGKRELVASILQSYIMKDIKALVREENIGAFNAIMYSLAQNEGKLVLNSSLARDARVSEPTVARHLDILAATYTCLSVPSYSTNLANELRKSRKVYLYDSGIRNALLKDFRKVAERPDRGGIYEAFVALSLWRRLGADSELRFWRSKKGEEVDFVLVSNRVPQAIEVKAAWSPDEVPSGMKAFLTCHPETRRGWVFTADGRRGLAEFKGVSICTLPLAEAETFDWSAE